jgi:hypothetical protein
MPTKQSKKPTIKPMIRLSEIAKNIEDRVSKETKGHYQNTSFAGAHIICGNTHRNVWIGNEQSQSTSGISYDITGQARGTYDTGRHHTLNEHGNNSVQIYKYRPIAQAILGQTLGDIRINNFHYDILASYIWGNSIHKKIHVGTVDMDNWRDMTLSEMYKGDVSEVSDKERAEIAEKLRLLEGKEDPTPIIVREKAALRNNPNLDVEQRKIVLGNIYDGTAVVIVGGPGTGKTSTLIQRLKYLITPIAINENREVEGKKPLTKTEIEIIEDDSRNWIFFSPTNLLCNYLRSNMESERLNYASSHTFVWNDYLRNIISQQYLLAGSDAPFDLKRKPLQGKKIFKKYSLALIKDFTNYYINTIIARVSKVCDAEYTNFDWSRVGLMIAKTCAEIKSAKSFSDVVRNLMKLENLREASINSELAIKPIVESYNDLMERTTLNHIIRFRKSGDIYDDLLSLVASWQQVKEDEESEDDLNEEQTAASTDSLDVKLKNSLKSLLRKLAIKTIDNKVAIKGNQAKLYELIKDNVNQSELNDVAQYAYFYVYFYPVVRNIENFLLSRITAEYKNYRRIALKQENSKDWYLSTLRIIVEEYNNRLLHQQEQALLLGIINNIILEIRKVSVPRYDKLKHPFAIAYKDCCRPIIGIDEATDYTIYDYYAMISLRHPVISSITLSGDLMQGLNESGISNWQSLKSTMLLNKLEVKELQVSYRQSPKLIALADHIYQSANGAPSPYRCNDTDLEHAPSPLWLKSNSVDKKADWLIKRILELKKFYNGKIPSIAIFVSSKDKIKDLIEALEEPEELEAAGIEVTDCSNELVDAPTDRVRVFPIDMVKGLEFQVVFFYDINEISNINLIDRYLYIGLSRATYHMGVTSSTELDDKTSAVCKMFDQTGHW